MADAIKNPEWKARGCRTLADCMAQFFADRVATDGIRASELSQRLSASSEARRKPTPLDKRRAEA